MFATIIDAQERAQAFDLHAVPGGWLGEALAWSAAGTRMAVRPGVIYDD